jgi:hypothetical protein
MQARDLDAPNLDTVRQPHGRSRPFLEDDPPTSAEDDPPASGEDGAFISDMPWDTKPTSRAASVVFVFLLLVLAGVGVALVYYGAATSKPTVPPEGFAELQQQLKSMAVDLAAVRNTLEQQSAANHDQFTGIQEQIAKQSIALQATKQELSQKLSSPPPDKPVQTPPPKPAQHPAHVSTQDSSKPIQVAPAEESPLPPKQ